MIQAPPKDVNPKEAILLLGNYSYFLIDALQRSNEDKRAIQNCLRTYSE